MFEGQKELEVVRSKEVMIVILAIDLELQLVKIKWIKSMISVSGVQIL